MTPKESTYLLADRDEDDEATTRITIPDFKCYGRALTDEDLEYYTAHPCWIKVRLILFWCFWATFLVLLILSIFIYYHTISTVY